MTGKQYELLAFRGELVDRISLDGVVVVGRAEDAQVRLPEDDRKASRYHAVFERNGDLVTLRDLGSKNGTWVNQVRVSSSVLVTPGDRVRIGGTDMVIEASGIGPAPTIEATLPAGSGLGDTIAAPAKPRYGAWRVVSELGAGAMGLVFRVVHEQSGIEAALKILNTELLKSPPMVARFVREQQLVVACEHPCLVRCFEAGEHNGVPYIASELVSGGEALALAGPRSDLGQLAQIMADVLGALAYVHALGFVHRDVKPDNILLTGTSDGVAAKLADFGLAKNLLEVGAASLTAEGAIAGTPLYLAPEQLLNFKRVGPCADLYSAAGTFYHLATGETALPLSGSLSSRSYTCSYNECISATLGSERVPLRQRRPDVPEAMAAFIDRLLERDSAYRSECAARGDAADRFRGLRE